MTTLRLIACCCLAAAPLAACAGGESPTEPAAPRAAQALSTDTTGVGAWTVQDRGETPTGGVLAEEACEDNGGGYGSGYRTC